MAIRKQFGSALTQVIGCLAVALFAPGSIASASATEESYKPGTVSVSADQLLELADQARDAGDYTTAETAYRAIFSDPSVEVRSEARFRLAMLLLRLSRLPGAAVLLREVLDEQPDAQRVRLELAHILDLMGDEAGARRALREAQAGGLPPDVARFVDRYSAALRAQRPLGASLEIALAPDSNINRATRSQTLGTVMGDFLLDDDAKERSGVGFALRGQGYARLLLGDEVNLFGRVSGSADLYRESAFHDYAFAVTLGPEFRLGVDRLSMEAGGVWRWYGGQSYSDAATLGFNYFHPLNRKAQLRGTANVSLVNNRLNRLQDGRTYSASLSYERALTSQSGIGLTLRADRQALRDPGYSTWAGQATLLGYRELGPMTLVTTLTLGRLKADERIYLFPEGRSETLYRASFGATFRNFRIGVFAPFVRATFERNRSTTEIHDYRKIRTEIGIIRAF